MDSITVGLWNLNETAGTQVGDSGPNRLRGSAGLDSRPEFGRFGQARRFTRSVNSFVHVAYLEPLETHHGMTIEAWIFPATFGLFESTPIAARWTPRANERSWILGLLGRQRSFSAGIASPLLLREVSQGQPGQLVFAFQPEEAGPTRVFPSTQVVELGRWTHVAASYDGEVVRIFVDGLLDGQFATPGRIRASTAPLLVGNFFDPRALTDFGGDLRIGPQGDPNPYYAFEGLIDEVRLSAGARVFDR